MNKQIIIKVQAIYYLLTGLWPLIHINSFLQVTGPKTDIWLVKMVGLLTCTIAITLFTAAEKISHTVLVLAASAALSYIAIDVYYYFNGTLRAVYLADAGVELIILALLLATKNKTNE